MRISGTLNPNIYNLNIPHAKIAGSCPHGNPSGTCPACLGMGGGGGSTVKPKPTARELGLLTWADLMPVWYAMLAAKNRKEYELVQQNMLDMLKLSEKTRLFQSINDFVNTKIMPALKLMDSKLIAPAVKGLNAAIKAINSVYSEIKTYMANQLEKAVAVINEKLNVFMEKLKGSLEMFKTAVERFISDLKEKEKDIKKNLMAYSKKIRDNLLGIIQAISASLGQQEDSDDYDEESEFRKIASYE